MFDISFFKNTYSLKREITANKFTTEDSEKIFSEFELQRYPKPYLFSIETTNNCNMTCVMCPRTTEMDRKIENMENQVFSRVAEQISPHKEESFEEWGSFVVNELGIEPDEKGENPFYFFISSRAVTMHGFGEPLFDKHLAERVRTLSEKGIPTYFSGNPSNIDIRAEI